jgi:hypothetical protein
MEERGLTREGAQRWLNQQAVICRRTVVELARKMV